MELTDKNTSTIIVNIHGLLGEQDGVQIEFEEELLVEEGEFVLDEVNYQIVRIINEDVECPIVYVVVLDILRQTWTPESVKVFAKVMSSSLQKILNNINGDSSPVELQGLAGSSKALIISLLSNKSRSSLGETFPVVVVCESFDIAEVLLHDIYYYFGKEGVYFFPFWDVLPYDNFSPQKELIAQRFQTLAALLNQQVR